MEKKTKTQNFKTLETETGVQEFVTTKEKQALVSNSECKPFGTSEIEDKFLRSLAEKYTNQEWFDLFVKN